MEDEKDLIIEKLKLENTFWRQKCDKLDKQDGLDGVDNSTRVEDYKDILTPNMRQLERFAVKEVLELFRFIQHLSNTIPGVKQYMDTHGCDALSLNAFDARHCDRNSDTGVSSLHSERHKTFSQHSNNGDNTDTEIDLLDENQRIKNSFSSRKVAKKRVTSVASYSQQNSRLQSIASESDDNLDDSIASVSTVKRGPLSSYPSKRGRLSTSPSIRGRMSTSPPKPMPTNSRLSTAKPPSVSASLAEDSPFHDSSNSSDEESLPKLSTNKIKIDSSKTNSCPVMAKRGKPSKSRTGSFECDYDRNKCTEVLSSKEAYDFHMDGHLNAKFICPFCEYTGPSISLIKRHIQFEREGGDREGSREAHKKAKYHSKFKIYRCTACKECHKIHERDETRCKHIARNPKLECCWSHDIDHEFKDHLKSVHLKKANHRSHNSDDDDDDHHSDKKRSIGKVVDNFVDNLYFSNNAKRRLLLKKFAAKKDTIDLNSDSDSDD